MKAQLAILVLLLALASSIGALFFQHQRYAALSARQDATIAQLQTKNAALEPQARAYQTIVEVRQLALKARDGARGPANRHRGVTSLSTVASRKLPAAPAPAPVTAQR